MLGSMHQYIGGGHRVGTSGTSFEVLDPSTGEVVEEVVLASPADVDAAVAAAGAAFEEWSRATPAERATVLARAAIEKRSEPALSRSIWPPS